MLRLHAPTRISPVSRRLRLTPLPSSLRSPTLKPSPHSSLRLRLTRRPFSHALRCSADEAAPGTGLSVAVGSSSIPLPGCKISPIENGFLLLSFAAFATAVAFASLVVAAVPTLFALRRTAISLAKLADTARDELPSTMAALRLSGMELSDLTLELTDLSQEIADGVNKSAQAVQAAEAGIRQMGDLAKQRTMSMIEERANLPDISLLPVVEGAAKKTSRAVGQAGKSLINLISGGESNTNRDNLLKNDDGDNMPSGHLGS